CLRVLQLLHPALEELVRDNPRLEVPLSLEDVGLDLFLGLTVRGSVVQQLLVTHCFDEDRAHLEVDDSQQVTLSNQDVRRSARLRLQPTSESRSLNDELRVPIRIQDIVNLVEHSTAEPTEQWRTVQSSATNLRLLCE